MDRNIITKRDAQAANARAHGLDPDVQVLALAFAEHFGHDKADRLDRNYARAILALPGYTITRTD